MAQTLRAVAAMLTVFSLASWVPGQENKVDLSGNWSFTVQTEAGAGSPTVTLKQEGERLTGHYSSAVLGEAELAGTVKGKELKFTFTVNVQGTSLDVSYSGTIEDKDTLKGVVDFGGLGQGTFSAKRK